MALGQPGAPGKSLNSEVPNQRAAEWRRGRNSDDLSYNAFRHAVMPRCWRTPIAVSAMQFCISARIVNESRN
jgi:hypothetical protein